jgi:hypothetical protein
MQESHYESDSHESAPIGATGVVAVALRWIGAVASVSLVIGIIYWGFLIGQRDATDVPVIRAMEGNARIVPDDPQGTQADNQGLAVNEVLAETTPTAVNTTTTLAPTAQTVTAEDETMSALVPVAPASTTTQNAEPIVVDAATLMVEINPVIEPSVAPDGMTLPLRRPDNFLQADPISDAIEGLLQELIPEEGDTSFETPDLPRPEPKFGNPLLDPGAALIQLGAYNSLEDAGDVWVEYQSEHGDLLANTQRYIEPIESGGRLLYRLRAAGFEGLDQTRALCAALDARGIDCISVTVQ